MRMRVLSLLFLLFLPAFALPANDDSNPKKFSPPSRKFRLTYKFTVKEIPPRTKRLRVWAPVAQSDSHQSVRVLSATDPAKTRMTREPEYGNRMMYVEIQNPAPGDAQFALEYEVA